MPSAPATPRRSTRSSAAAIFTPLSAVRAPPATYTWTSNPVASTSSSSAGRTHYTSFARIRSAAATPRRKKDDDEARFALGDGVSVTVEGGNEGIGMLTALWEEPVPEDEDEDEDGDREKERDGDEEAGEGRTRKMARVHWFFRRSDLPSVMRNLTLEDVSVDGRGGQREKELTAERGTLSRLADESRDHRPAARAAHQDGADLLARRVQGAVSRGG